jgi:hypothetical protein
MKKEILKIAGVKSEKEFYKKYPTEEAFMKAHKKEFKKAAMGAAMVKKQLNQLTDFANPPQAEVGDYIGGDQSAAFKPMNYTDIYDQADYATTGMNRQMRMQDANLAAQQLQAKNAGKKGGIDLGSLMQSAGTIAQIAGAFEYGGDIKRAQEGADIADYRAGFESTFTQPSSDVAGYRSDFESTFKPAGQMGSSSGQKGFLNQIGGPAGAIPIVGDLVQGFQQLKQEKDLKRQARQSFELSGLTKQVAGLAPDIAKRKYVRPEDQAFGTQEMGQTYGAGTNFLAANGAMIGGNPTEIQNIYNPGDLYSNLGYEPLSDSEKIKQYRHGGKANFGDSISGMGTDMFSQAGTTLGSLIGGGHGAPNAGGKIGGTIGSTVGKFIPIPGASQALAFVGSAVGGAFGGKSAKQTERYQTGAQNNLQNTAFMQGVRGIQGQNSAYMEDGGWVSHDWQPQVITQFGEYDMKDLLKPPHDADMLRAGGHLKNYTAPSARAMSTERPDYFAMGGQLKTTWGGDAETISQNPYLPGSGETVMFRGQSHDESDGRGHTGIGVKYGQGAQDSYTDYAEYGTEQADADVEVERGEPATELTDSETGDVSMVVYGNMQIPSYGAAELGDPKVKGKKFKSYANELSKMEAKQNKTVEKGTKLIDSIDGDNPFDLLKLNSGYAMVMGANEKLKGLAIQKQRLAGIQNAILDTAEEMGVESDALSKGQIKRIKDSNMAKFGGKFTQAQNGVIAQEKQPTTDYDRFINRWPNLLQSVENRTQPVTISKKDLGIKDIDVRAPDIKISKDDVPKLEDLRKDTESKKDRFTIEDALRQLQPYLIPSNQQPFDYGQITPEMYALASNQLEPVQAQMFQPLLEQPYTVSLQDQLNANQADFNALQRQLGYNPAAASALAAQKYAANSGILGQQLRLNQELQMGAFNRNRGVLNDAALKNLAILDTQYQRQSAAKSATKAQAQAALSSIADKIAKHKLENRTLGVYENMYNYRFGPKGRAINANAPMDWNIDVASLNSGELDAIKKAKEIMEKKSSKKESTAKNGSIVKAIKNL